MLNDIRSAVKNSIIYGIGNLSTKLVGFVLLPLYTKHLTVSDYGALSILEISAQVFSSVFGLCLYQAFARWYWDKRYVPRQASMFFTVFVFLISTSIIAGIIFYLFSDQLSALIFSGGNFSFVLKLLIVSATFDIIFQVPNSLIRLQEKPVLFTSANIVKLSISLSLTVYFITSLHLKLEGIYFAQICSQVVYFLFLSKFILKNIKIKFEGTILKEMVLFSLPLALSSFATIMLSISDRYILKFLGTLSDVGVYSLGYKLANTIYVFIVTSVNLAISPMIYKKIDEPEHKRFYSKLMTYYVFGVMFCAIGMSLFGKEVVKILAQDPSFYGAYRVIPIISFSIVFMVMRDTAFIGLWKMQKSKVIASIVFVTSVVNIFLNFLFIHFFKEIGAAIATICSQALFFILVYVLAQKIYEIPYEVKKLVKLFIVAIILTILASFTNDSSLLVRLLFKTFLLFSFPVILYFFQFYDKIELERIYEFWIKWRNPGKWKNNLSAKK